MYWVLLAQSEQRQAHPSRRKPVLFGMGIPAPSAPRPFPVAGMLDPASHMTLELNTATQTCFMQSYPAIL